ncbi:hypothetical protein AAFF_G00017980 [Aldrovandia affinis]|uniref:Uncharacterized protein n=1 Tax=Aldrovandia affinis TaxID=143900 RepID=A0AAD7WGU5_9TELE|nr:hypothetical protein AAFF_G00017980 [Aldrovandia affinis]
MIKCDSKHSFTFLMYSTLKHYIRSRPIKGDYRVFILFFSILKYFYISSHCVSRCHCAPQFVKASISLRQNTLSGCRDGLVFFGCVWTGIFHVSIRTTLSHRLVSVLSKVQWVD